MAQTLKSIFEAECGDLPIDPPFVSRIADFERGFANKNQDHVKFFGGCLLGVNPVRWVDAEYNYWFDEILEADDIELRKHVHDLPDIDPEWKVSSDILNVSTVWTLHAIHHSTKLNPAQKEKGKLATMQLLHYKFISSMLSHYFPFPADRATAQTAYSVLTKKYDLKLYGNWTKFFYERAKAIIAPGSIHYKTYVNFTDTKAVIYMLNDIQGRLRSVVKNIVKVFYEIKETGSVIKSTVSVGTGTEGAYLKDKKSTFLKYKRYVLTVVTDRKSFIRADLLALITDKVMKTSRDWLVLKALERMSDTFTDPKSKYLEELVDDTLLHAFDTMISQRIRANDYPKILDKLRTVYMASRTSDPAVIRMRAWGEQLVKEVLPPGRGTVVAPERTAILLYIVLRTLTMDHYS